MSRRLIFAILLLCVLSACGGDDGDGGEPALFPADYASTYQEVHNCRKSLEHFVRQRILVSADAFTPYEERATPFPTGAIVLKEEYDEGDDTCAGPIVGYTVMKKLDVGSSPETLDWEWQEVNADFREVETDLKRCTQCHMRCGQSPLGYDGTCTWQD